MPKYQFYRLTQTGRASTPDEHAHFNDAAAIRHAMSPAFPHGCDLWNGARYVGQLHGPHAPRPAGIAQTVD